MDNNANKLVGELFGSIGYSSNDDLRNLIDGLTLEQSIIFINKSLEYSYGKGVFTMVETELISKCLSLLNSKVFTKPNETEES